MIFETINSYILEYFYYLFIGLLFINIYIGFKGKDFSKRIPLILIALLFFLVYVSAVLTKVKGLPVYLPLIFFVMLFGTSFTLFRERFFPYRFKCVKCGKKLTPTNIFFEEGYICGDCKGDGEEEVSAIEKDGEDRGEE